MRQRPPLRHERAGWVLPSVHRDQRALLFFDLTSGRLVNTDQHVECKAGPSTMGVAASGDCSRASPTHLRTLAQGKGRGPRA